MKSLIVYLLIALTALELGHAAPAAAQGPKKASAAPQPADPAAQLYRQLAQKIRSQLQRAPEVTLDESKPLSLEDCLGIALKNSGKLLIAREKMLAAKMRYSEARRNLLPNLKFIGHMREGTLTSQTFKGEDYKVQGSFDALDGGKKFQSLDQAKTNYIVAKKTYERLRSDILYQARQAFYALNRSMAVYQELLAVGGKTQALAQKGKGMFEKQLIRNVDYMGLVAGYQEVNAQLLAAGQDLTISRMALCQVLHAYPENPPRIKPLGDYKPLQNVSLEQCLSLALRYRPDITLAILNSELMKISVDLAESSTGFMGSASGHFGHKGEAFNSAKEGIQTRPDMKLTVNSSMPLEKHTLKYDGDFVKEVPNVGSTTSTLYNSHTMTFDFFNNTRDRQIFEAKISYHDNLDDLETLKKNVISDVARQYLDVQRAAMSVDSAQLAYQLAEERSKVVLSGAGATAIGPDDELQAMLGVSSAKRRVMDTRIQYLSVINALNRAIGVDNFYDPFRGVISKPKDEPFRRIKKVWEFWKDDALEQDNALLPTKMYDDYLTAGAGAKN